MIFKIIIGAKIEKIFKTKRFVVRFRGKIIPYTFFIHFYSKKQKKNKNKNKKFNSKETILQGMHLSNTILKISYYYHIK